MKDKGFQPTSHPVLGLPTPAQAYALGEARWREVLARRERIIAAERADPFRNCWEPPIWRVADAIMGFPWVDGEWAERMRRHLGFDRPAPVVLVNGGNRAGKSQWAANRTMRVLLQRASARAWALHSTLPMSRQYQQPLFYSMLPPGLRGADIKSKTTYIAYKQKTGFSEEQFVLPPSVPGVSGSDCVFKTYDQDVTSIEGGNLDVVWPDELVPPDWVETLEFRIAEKNGWMPITFTPVQGYSPTVKLFQDGAVVAKWCVGFLCPRDGGPPDVARAMGFDDQPEGGLTAAEQWEEVLKAGREGRASYYPQSIPEQCERWIEEIPTSNIQHPEKDQDPNSKDGDDVEGVRAGAQRSAHPTSQPAVPKGREFELVPRVLRCVSAEGKRAVILFYSSDNPYGNPKEIWGTLAGRATDFVKERFYGMGTKVSATRFPKFNVAVHVVGPEQVPTAGTNYHYVDPSSGRNFFMVWFRVTPEGVWAYREWPGNYYVRGVGVPGPWALPDGKRPDGRPGPGQSPFGWGNRDYKRQIAELEGWRDFEKWRTGGAAEAPSTNIQHPVPLSGIQNSNPKAEEVDGWDEGNGAVEVVARRSMDSRFASTPRMENDRPTTLLTDFEELLVFFEPTPGGPIHEGVQKINDLLNYDEGKPVDFYNKPRLRISSDCVNLIFALQTWTGRDGEKGACKDPIDCLHYFAVDECPYRGDGGEVEEEEEKVSEFSEPIKTYY